MRRGRWWDLRECGDCGKIYFLSNLEVLSGVGLFTREEVQIAIDKRPKNRLAGGLIGDSNDLPLLRVLDLC